MAKSEGEDLAGNPDASSGEQDLNNGDPDQKPNLEKRKERISKAKSIWAKTELDMPTLLMMFKAAVPPTIAIAFYQSNPVAAEYNTLGYLVGIASILGFAIMPRAKFIQTMILNVLSICIGTSIGLLAVWSAIQAHHHTTPPGQPLRGYNSSASAVCAIWLFFQILVVNAVRSARPQLQFPAIIYCILADIYMIYGPSFGTMAQAITFGITLLKTFLTGFALSTGTNLLVFPVNSRKVVFMEMTGYLKGLSSVWNAQTNYLHSFQGVNLSSLDTHQKDGTGSHSWRRRKGQRTTEKSVDISLVSVETEALKKSAAAIIALNGKLHADLLFAKREFGFGKLSGSDLSEIVKLMRLTLLPTVGLSCIVDICERVSKFQQWDKLSHLDEREGLKQAPDPSRKSFADWQAIMEALQMPFADLVTVLNEGIQHVLYTLELEKRPRKQGIDDHSDIESKGKSSKPGQLEFSKYFEHKIQGFQEVRKLILKTWCKERGVQLPADTFETPVNWAEYHGNPDGSQRERDQRQIFLILYMEHLLLSASRGLLDLVHFADSKISDGTLKKKRFIFPPYKRVKKWIKNVFSHEDSSNTDHRIMAELDSSHDVDLGDAFNARKDPEHLPPETTIERIGDCVRVVPGLLRSPHTAFGLRAGCATMSIAIIAFLRDTQNFFTQQRLVWGLIIVAFSMARTSGQSVFNFVLRVFGTFVAMVAAYVVWYIVDGKAPGVIVFLFLWIFACFYMVLKKPNLVIVGIISPITTLLIIGYELQVQKIGIKASTASGQPYYPPYSLAPYRLAVVAGGLLVAYIWTIFPYPITETSELRKDLGGSLFLLAKFYSVVHSTVVTRLESDSYQIPLNSKDHPIHRLDRIRHSVFSKSYILLNKLRVGQAFTKWQVSVGGRFPSETYNDIITCAERVLTYTALIGFASASFGPSAEGSDTNGTMEQEAKETEWQRDFKRLLSSLAPTSHQITSRLALLSSSVQNGQPLPPYMLPLEPFHLLSQMEQVDRELLSVKHIAEPNYAAFAVLQIATRSLVGDLNALTEHVKNLVGELDFSFHVASTAEHGTSKKL